MSDQSRASLDLIVRGRLALPGGRLVFGDLGVRDGRIATIADAGSLGGATVLGARDSLVLPGVVDVHVHTSSEPEEGIERATRAAAAGGVTTIVDMPFDAGGPVTTPSGVRAKTKTIAASAVTDVALYGTVPASGDLEHIESLVDAGVAAFKLSTFETDPTRFPRSTDFTILQAMERVRDAGSLLAFHCENNEIIEGLTARLAAERSGTDAETHAVARPAVAENAALAGVLELALATLAPIHLCHVSTGRGVTLALRAKADGADVTTETCPHHLLLDEGELRRQRGRAKVNPPLRSRAEIETLWEFLAAGAIDIVSSDHVGWLAASKDREDFLDVPAGFPAVELTLSLLFSEGVLRRRLPMQRLIEVLCEAPARRFGLWPRKGALCVDGDADIVVLDPKVRWRIDNDALTTAAGWSPYAGLEVTGRITSVLVRGEPVILAGEPTGRPPHGELVRPTRSRRSASPELERSEVVAATMSPSS